MDLEEDPQRPEGMDVDEQTKFTSKSKNVVQQNDPSNHDNSATSSSTLVVGNTNLQEDRNPTESKLSAVGGASIAPQKEQSPSFFDTDNKDSNCQENLQHHCLHPSHPVSRPRYRTSSTPQMDNSKAQPESKLPPLLEDQQQQRSHLPDGKSSEDDVTDKHDAGAPVEPMVRLSALRKTDLQMPPPLQRDFSPTFFPLQCPG